MTTFRSFFVPIIIVAIGAGCARSSSPAAPSPITQDRLAGTWTLTVIEPAGEPAQPAPPNARYSLTFDEGRLSTRADCNVCSAAFMLSGDALTTGPGLACTRAACPTMAFGNAYTALLTGENMMSLAGDALMLSSPRGMLRFTR